MVALSTFTLSSHQTLVRAAVFPSRGTVFSELPCGHVINFWQNKEKDKENLVEILKEVGGGALSYSLLLSPAALNAGGAGALEVSFECHILES